MKLSVLLAVLCYCRTISCRRIMDQIETNEVDVGPEENLGFSNSQEWIKISEPPLANMAAMVGTRVELECEAIGSPTPVMQWFKDHQKLTENESYDSNSIIDGPLHSVARIRTRLVINHALPIHDGIFSCFAESGSQVAIAKTRLRVLKQPDRTSNFTTLLASQLFGAPHLPRITLWAPTMMNLLGSDAVLPCQTVGNPKPELMWLDPYGNVIVNSDERAGRVSVLPDGALRIRSLVWNDMGTYTCMSSNKMGQDKIDTFLYPMKETK